MAKSKAPIAHMIRANLFGGYAAICGEQPPLEGFLNNWRALAKYERPCAKCLAKRPKAKGAKRGAK